MDIQGLFNRLGRSQVAINIATLAVVLVWAMIVVAFIAISILLLEQPSHTLPPEPGETTPMIRVEPEAGPPGTTVRVHGEGWKPGSMILVYLMAPGETELPNYAVAGFNADALGRFTTGFAVPSGSGWETQGLATVVAQVAEGGAAAQAFFSVMKPTPTMVVTLEPTPTPTQVVAPTPTLAPQPGPPMATAVTDLNVRGGPGISYPILGVLRAHQSTEIVGVSADRGWWQVYFAGTSEQRGWVSAYYVTTQNADNVPVIQAAPPPPTATPTATPTPTPTATPVVIYDWRAEYFNNPHLSGAPVLVRNDVAINFDWGEGSPGSGLPTDDFSVSWSRGLSFPAGSYRFYARVDDGVRLWVDGTLIIDEWHDSAPTTYSANLYLSDGWHNLRMEYYERSGGALAQLAWERQEEDYPDWKAEYYDNRNLDGDPVLVRNESEIDHNWGTGSPGSGVPSDNFSARWTRKVEFKDGTYLFRVRVDDGARLWIGDTLVIDGWKDGNSRWLEEEHEVDEGKHRVKVEYYEHWGDAEIEVTWKRVEEPSNKPPNALPGGSYTIDEGSQVTLDGSGSTDSDGSIARYEWDLDYDGKTFVADAQGQKVSTSYPDGPATHTVALRVTDDKDAKDTATTQVLVRNVAPSAEAGGPYVGQVGNLISMAGTATDRGSIDQAGLTYRWEFGDGTTGNGPIVSHSYAQAGNYTLTLTVTDKDGAQGTDTATVEVREVNQPPTAAISGPVNGMVGDTLSFDGSGSSDSDGSIVSYAWNFGDENTGGGVSATHSYAAAGSYQVTLTVTDNGGLTGETTHTIQIDEPPPVNQPPTAAISGPVNGLVEDTLTFDGSGSSDSDGSIVSYAWNFGDGNTGGGVSATHSYAAAGSYQVTLTVADNGGLTGQATHTIQINETPPVSQPPAAAISGPVNGLVGDTLSFDGSGSSDKDGSIVSYAWDFGDGGTASGVNVDHAYQQVGIYQISLTVTDDSGLAGETTHPIQIDEVAPANLPPTEFNNGG